MFSLEILPHTITSHLIMSLSIAQQSAEVVTAVSERDDIAALLDENEDEAEIAKIVEKMSAIEKRNEQLCDARRKIAARQCELEKELLALKKTDEKLCAKLAESDGKLGALLNLLHVLKPVAEETKEQKEEQEEQEDEGTESDGDGDEETDDDLESVDVIIGDKCFTTKDKSVTTQERHQPWNTIVGKENSSATPHVFPKKMPALHFSHHEKEAKAFDACKFRAFVQKHVAKYGSLPISCSSFDVNAKCFHKAGEPCTFFHLCNRLGRGGDFKCQLRTCNKPLAECGIREDGTSACSSLVPCKFCDGYISPNGEKNTHAKGMCPNWNENARPYSLPPCKFCDGFVSESGEPNTHPFGKCPCF